MGDLELVFRIEVLSSGSGVDNVFEYTRTHTHAHTHTHTHTHKHTNAHMHTRRIEVLSSGSGVNEFFEQVVNLAVFRCSQPVDVCMCVCE